jgi:hypothetical protein
VIWALVAVVLVVVVTGATFGIIELVAHQSEAHQRQQIAQVTRDFVVAVERNDTTRAANCFCAPEAEHFLEVDESDSTVDRDVRPSGSSDGAAKGLKVRDIVVRGDVASATAANTLGDQTLYYRKEGGRWKLCDAAKSDFDSAGAG